jgi:hypothetical protein
VNYQQWFHVKPLLILDPINWGPAFWPKITWQNFISLILNHRRTAKEATGAHSAAAGIPSSLPLSGPHHCRRRRVGTPSPLPPLCRDLFDARSIGTPHLYVLSSTAVDLWALLPPPLNSYWAAPPWGTLPSEIPFPLTLPLIAGSRSWPGCHRRCAV